MNEPALLCLGLVVLIGCSGSVTNDTHPGADAGVPVPEADAANETATTFCKLLFDCKCTMLSYSTEADCVSAERAKFEARQKEAHDHSLTYDGLCLAQKLAALTARGCTGYGVVIDQRQFAACDSTTCAIYHGAIPDDAYCGYASTFTDCIQGSTCNQGDGGDGRCHPFCPTPLPVAPDGAPCVDAMGSITNSCSSNAFCDAGGTGTCYVFPPPGQPCYLGFCAKGAYCAMTTTPPTCEPRKPDGAMCTTGLECVDFGCNGGICGADSAYVCIDTAP